MIKSGETHCKIIQITTKHAPECRIGILPDSSQFFHPLKTGFRNLHGNLGKICTPLWSQAVAGVRFPVGTSPLGVVIAVFLGKLL